MKRWILLPLCLVPAAAFAQTQSADPALARSLPNAEVVETALQSTLPERTTTLAGGSGADDARISRNEAYNLGRAASGRVGVRLGNDVSFRIGKNGR